MRPIEKKIRDKIKEYEKIDKNNDLKFAFCPARINELEWVLSELQKESDLMQEMLEVLEMISFCEDISASTNITIEDIIQKVKQEMESNNE